MAQLNEETQENLYMSLFEKNILDRQFYKRERISKRTDNRLNERFELNMIKHE